MYAEQYTYPCRESLKKGGERSRIFREHPRGRQKCKKGRRKERDMTGISSAVMGEGAEGLRAFGAADLVDGYHLTSVASSQ